MIKMLVATLGMAAVGWMVWKMLARQEAADGDPADTPGRAPGNAPDSEDTNRRPTDD